jgi:hypothetical protein
MYGSYDEDHGSESNVGPASGKELDEFVAQGLPEHEITFGI